MSIIDDITGKTQSDAALEAARLQADAGAQAAQLAAQTGRDQIAAQQQAAATQRADLQPFTQFGSSMIDPTQQAVGQAQQLYSDPMSIMQNPMFQAIQAQNQQNIMQNAAISGRLGTGGTQQHLQDSALRTGFDILNQERAAQLQNAGFLSSLVGMGQNAAANQGMGALQAGQGIMGALGSSAANQNAYNTDAAAALAAGQVGAANAQVAGTGNLIGLGTSLATGGIGGLGGLAAGFGAGAGDFASKLGMPTIGTALNPTKIATLPGQTYGR